MTLSELFANIENTRGQIKRRGLSDLLNIMGEHVAQNIAGPGLLAAEHARSVMPEVREPARQRMTDTALGLLGAIKAYHGSPHKFDKFSMDRIGTGEGAQAYGHGLYFAESPSVAMDYQRRLSSASDQATYTWRGETYQPLTPQTHAISLAFHDSPATARRIGEEGLAAAKRGEPWAVEQGGEAYWSQMLQTAKAIKSKSSIKREVGNLYEVSLRWPDAAREAKDPLGPQHFLDWDKPLAGQSEAVRKIGGEVFANEPRFDPKYTRGMEVYQALHSGGPHAQPGTSKKLRDAGIPGIRYLDGGSRAAGEGTANYVTFDDALVEILKRNGINIR